MSGSYKFPPKGSVPHRMSDKTMALLEQVSKPGRLHDGRVSSSTELGRNKNGVAWDDNVNPPSRKLIAPGRPNRAPAGYTKTVEKEPRRRQYSAVAQLKKPRKFTKMNPYELPPEGSQYRAAHGLPPIKPMATRDKSNEMIVNALRFGERQFSRGMTVDDIVDSLSGCYILPSGPNFILGITAALTQLVSRGLISKTYGLGIVESRYKLLYYNGPDCGLSICGLPVSEIPKWPSGKGLPGGTSLITRPARVTCTSFIKRGAVETPLEPKDYIRRSYVPGDKLPPLVPNGMESPFDPTYLPCDKFPPFVPRVMEFPLDAKDCTRRSYLPCDKFPPFVPRVMEFPLDAKDCTRRSYLPGEKLPPLVPRGMENPMYAMSFADRAGGLDCLKPDYVRRPNTPVSGSSEERGEPNRRESRGPQSFNEEQTDYQEDCGTRPTTAMESTYDPLAYQKYAEEEAGDPRPVLFEDVENLCNMGGDGGLEFFKPGYLRRPKSPVSGSSEERGERKGCESRGPQSYNEEQMQYEADCRRRPKTAKESAYDYWPYQKYSSSEEEDDHLRSSLFGNGDNMCSFGGAGGLEFLEPGNVRRPKTPIPGSCEERGGQQGCESGELQYFNEEQTEEECGIRPTTAMESTYKPMHCPKYAEEETENPRSGLFGDVENLCNFGGARNESDSGSDETESDETSEDEEEDSDTSGGAAFKMSDDLRNMNFSDC